MGFSEHMQAVSRDIWEREKTHPFVTGMGDGTLPAEKFRFYLEQDYLFLIEYAKVFALGVHKADSLAVMAYMAQLCSDTLNGEMELHRSYCAEFGITPAALESARPASTTLGYTGHLLDVARSGDMARIIAAVLPCQWGYAEIARHLEARGMPPEPRYARWVRMYASEEFDAYGLWLREQMDRLAGGMDPAAREELKSIFHASSTWEYRFWDMAWHMAMEDLPPGGL